jgi:SAM-dependent methyltransferase
MNIHPTAGGFDRAAAEYEVGRPGYPPAAVDLVATRLGVGPDRLVLDVGAGTGKLTRELLARGAEVVAVEPVPGMREQLAVSVPSDRLRILDGTAEAIPLADGSVDAATVAQAFHWFDGEGALAELHRVLRPDASLAIVFNRRDLQTPMQAALDELLAPYREDTPSWARHDWDAALTTTDRFDPDPAGIATFPWSQQLTLDGLRARVASISFVSQLDPATRERVLGAAAALAAEHRGSGSAASPTVDLHYVAEVRLLRRRSVP